MHCIHVHYIPHTRTHARTCTHMHAHTRTCTHTHTHMHAHAHTHMHAHTRTCTHTHTHMHAHAHTHTHAHTLNFWVPNYKDSALLCRMPEFRFRRKKKQQQASRRHTLHDPEVAHAQVAAAREMVKREEVRGRGGGIYM